MSTIRKVAEQAAVSTATVSRVLNNQPGVSDTVRNRVLDAVNRCGYVANVGRRSTSFLAFVYTGPATIDGIFDNAIFTGMVDATDESELDLVLLNLHRDKKSAESYTQFFLRKGVRGVVLRSTMRSRSICEEIFDEGFPAIVVGDRFERADASYIYSDSFGTSKRAVEHLIGLGHQRIAIAISDLVEDSDHADRFAAYKAALAEHNIPFDHRLHYRVPPDRAQGAQVVRKMMSMSDPPTALFVTDPLVAIGAINESHRLEIRIPHDLSILGFDDGDIRDQVYPKMTAVCQDSKRLGYEAFLELSRAVLERASEEDEALLNHTVIVREALPTWLEVNATTGQPAMHSLRVLPDGTRVDS